MPEDSTEAALVAAPPDVVATVYSLPSERPRTVMLSEEMDEVSVQPAPSPSALVTVIVSPTATPGAPLMLSLIHI